MRDKQATNELQGSGKLLEAFVIVVQRVLLFCLGARSCRRRLQAFAEPLVHDEAAIHVVPVSDGTLAVTVVQQ